jgi:DNA-binding NarL/FixJ family response regulator
MPLLLCSEKESVRQRWLKCLEKASLSYQASSFEEVQNHLRSFEIEVMLLHRAMIDTKKLKAVCEKAGDAKIIILSDRPHDAEGIVCLRHGCLGYGNTYISESRLAAAVESVGDGLAWVNSSLMAALIVGLSSLDGPGELPDKGEGIAALETLSSREYQIAQLVSEGLKNGEIAAEAGVTERTVKAHLSSIYAKTGTRGRLNLALLVQNAERSS